MIGKGKMGFLRFPCIKESKLGLRNVHQLNHDSKKNEILKTKWKPKTISQIIIFLSFTNRSRVISNFNVKSRNIWCLVLTMMYGFELQLLLPLKSEKPLFLALIILFYETLTVGLLICTLISENQGLEKARSISNPRKISGSANLYFFFRSPPWKKAGFIL